jgi:hypothetical protein
MNHPLLNRTRRHFFRDCSLGLAGLWFGSERGLAAAALAKDPASPWRASTPHFRPRAKRVIYLHMAGSPSQLELFDHKPELNRLDGRDCPQSFLEGQQFAFIQGVPKMLGGQYAFQQHGQSGQWISDRLPHLARCADDLCVVKSMHTDQFNHGPAQMLMHTGMATAGGASFGSWSLYGLGSENDNLPGFIVLTSGGKNPDAGKSVWGSGYLPSVYQGVQCRSSGEPVLFLQNPPGIDRSQRRRSLDALAEINARTAAEVGDPETLTRIAQYEMAFRMQVAAADAFDLSQEPPDVHELYGTQPGRESFANNCLLARRLAERGVRFIQLFDWGWDSHGAGKEEALNHGFKDKCLSVDQACSALLTDLKRRGLLDDTLVIWGGEFGRTPMRENRNGVEMAFIGRDHNPGAFTVWMAGGGARPGISYGSTDDFGYQAVIDRVSVHDFHATVLALLGFDHLRLTHSANGVAMRLSNVTKPGSQIVSGLMG